MNFINTSHKNMGFFALNDSRPEDELEIKLNKLAESAEKMNKITGTVETREAALLIKETSQKIHELLFSSREQQPEDTQTSRSFF